MMRTKVYSHAHALSLPLADIKLHFICHFEVLFVILNGTSLCHPHTLWLNLLRYIRHHHTHTYNVSWTALLIWHSRYISFRFFVSFIWNRNGNEIQKFFVTIIHCLCIMLMIHHCRVPTHNRNLFAENCLNILSISVWQREEIINWNRYSAMFCCFCFNFGAISHYIFVVIVAAAAKKTKQKKTVDAATQVAVLFIAHTVCRSGKRESADTSIKFYIYVKCTLHSFCDYISESIRSPFHERRLPPNGRIRSKFCKKLYCFRLYTIFCHNKQTTHATTTKNIYLKHNIQ